MNASREDTLLGGKPHLLTALAFLPLLPPCGTAVWQVWQRTGVGIAFWCVLAGTLLLLSASAGIGFARRAACRWEVRRNVLTMTCGWFRRRTVRFCLGRLAVAEWKQGPLLSLFRGARVKLYAAGKKPVCSLLLPAAAAAALVNRAAAGESGLKGHTRRMVSGRWAAALGALDCRAVLLPLSAAPFAAASGICSARWLWYALLLLAGSIGIFTVRLLRECRMAVEMTERGFALRMGLPVVRRLFVPHTAVVGVWEGRGPIAAMCGAGRFSLVCENGARIPCMRWYEGGCGREAAGRLLGCEGADRAQAADAGAFRRRMMRFTVGGLLLGAGVLLYALAKGNLPAVMLSAWAETVWQIHCRMGVIFAEECGVSVGASVLRVGGMRPLLAQRLTLRRGCVAAVCLRRGVAERYGGTCAAELIPDGNRRGVACPCVPQGGMLAMTERFC